MEVEAVAADSAASPPIVTTFSETFAETETICFQIIDLGEATYLWIGSEEARMDHLALGVPMTKGSMPASGTTLLGSSSDAASQTMAQRLAKKLGRPVFVSLNLKDEPNLRHYVSHGFVVIFPYVISPKKDKSPLTTNITLSM